MDHFMIFMTQSLGPYYISCMAWSLFFITIYETTYRPFYSIYMIDGLAIFNTLHETRNISYHKTWDQVPFLKFYMRPWIIFYLFPDRVPIFNCKTWDHGPFNIFYMAWSLVFTFLMWPYFILHFLHGMVFFNMRPWAILYLLHTRVSYFAYWYLTRNLSTVVHYTDGPFLPLNMRPWTILFF